ncbi:MAG: VTT domain-containing protein [Bacteroidetes bacterium]|nr:VTT domain-containing protein [Bacteroidota bacterium]
MKSVPARRQLWIRTVTGLTLFGAALWIFLASGIREVVAVDHLRELGANPLTPVLIVLAMTGAWAFALPGSAFFFITPLLFPPLEATAIITIGSAAGTTAGYAAARFVGGPWVDRARSSRWNQFLARHSTFGMIFTLRIVPGSQHGILNYSAGALAIGFMKFLGATILAIGIKGFLYATAIQQSVGASNIREALNSETVAALMGLATLGVAGHLIQRRAERGDRI